MVKKNTYFGKGMNMSAPVTIATHRRQIQETLDELYQVANLRWREQTEAEHIDWKLPEELLSLTDAFWEQALGRAVTAITNLTTCLISKVVEPDIDCRYHREPGDGMPEQPGGANNYFSGRVISEKIVVPWLINKNFQTSKSGWQTRTFERPRPYLLKYPENIAYVKDT